MSAIRSSRSRVEILLIDRELPLDVVERREVVLEQREPLADDRGVPLGERRRDAERVEQLELDAPRRVERRPRCSAPAPRSGSPARPPGRPAWRGAPAAR